MTLIRESEVMNMNEMMSELGQMFVDNPVSMIGGVMLGVGFLFLICATFSYRFRAFTNKKAWDGKTRPFVKLALVFFVVGAVLFALGLI
jgi:uncharacterized membrane protein YgdD (TMEM256/DUF423 family)